MTGAERIAVLRANAVGDYLMALPALHGLREAYPQAQIVLVGGPWQARTLAGRPGPSDEVLVLPAVPGLAGLSPDAPSGEQLPAFLDGIRRRRLDVVVQLHGGGAASNPLVREFGAGLTAGLRAADAEPLDRWVPYRFYQPEVARALEAVALVGAGVPAGPVRFVGLFWCGNAITTGPATRTTHRVLLSWTLHCPECGEDCTRDLYPHRPGEGCAHRCSFVADIPLTEVLAESADLLGWAGPDS